MKTCNTISNLEQRSKYASTLTPIFTISTFASSWAWKWGNKNTGLLNTDRMYFFVDKMSTFTLILLDLTTCPA